MGRRAASSAEGSDINTSAWMVTFADLIMLMLTFFVLLLSMSSMDKKRLKEMFSHLTQATGVLEFAGQQQIGFSNFVQKYNEFSTKLMLDMDLLNKLFLPAVPAQANMEDIEKLVNISDDVRGIVITFQEEILFGSGEVAVRKQALSVLDSIAESIASCSNAMLIMGHTDNVPIRSRLYESNWELSLHRGLTILDYFLEEKQLPPSRFSVGGYGPSRPVSSNATPEGRASNRRVEIVFRHLQET